MAGGGPKSLGGIIPDVVDGVEEGEGCGLHLHFGTHKAEGGVELRPSQAAHAPRVEIKGEGGPFALVATDPDAPSPANPTRREWLHWMVTDIPAGGDVSRGREVIHYMGPAPPEGVHRYAFLLFRQPSVGLKVEAPSQRAHFNTRRFAEQHGLGRPVAVQYFTAQPPQ